MQGRLRPGWPSTGCAHGSARWPGRRRARSWCAAGRAPLPIGPRCVACAPRPPAAAGFPRPHKHETEPRISQITTDEPLAARGRLGHERLQVEDRQLAVEDRVVCGKNAISELGVANGSRGTITALDPQDRTLTMRLDGPDGRTVTLPRSYLDGRGRGERNRRVDLAYATTGHRAQGLTRGRALVRLTGSEDVNWLYVQLSRARQDTRLYAVVGPEPQGAS